MSLGNKMFTGALWSMGEKLSVQFASFSIGIILARLLTPKEYGTIGLLIVFITFGQVFIDAGFGKALIQKQNRTENDISTVFYFNLIIALLCYLIIWLAAPFIADFYNIPNLHNLLRVLSISLFFNALFTVPNTLLNIEMNFKEITKVNLVSTLISGAIAIYLAYQNYGEWALVYHTVIKSILMATLIWFSIKWKPLFIFSKKSFKGLYGFGSKLLVNSLLNNLVNNITSLFIAKLINAKQLGFYSRGTQFADIAFSIFNSIIDNVLLPGLSPLQEQKLLLISETKKIIKITAIVVIPLFLSLSLFTKPIIIILLTEKWAEAIPIMQIICISRMITIISGINVNILYVLGRTDLALKQQYFKIAVRVILLIVAIPYGIIYIALAELLTTIIHYFINTYYPGKIMQHGALKQLKDMFLIIASALTMVIVGYFAMLNFENEILKIIIATPLMLIVYIILIKLFKVKEFELLISKLISLKS